jgi:dihydrolipoamide dehydrogenase
MSEPINTDLVVLGAGPGGYTAAFRAADLGLSVTLVDKEKSLGGVCLNVGCIPSKTLLHVAKVIDEAKDLGNHGVNFGQPKIELDQLRSWKDKVINNLTGGLSGLAKKRNVRVLQGNGSFIDANTIKVESEGQVTEVSFKSCIIAVGSEPIDLGYGVGPRLMDSTGALELKDLPDRLLVIGGGIIGLEMATVYSALGVKVSIVELTKTLIPTADRDLIKPLENRLKNQCEEIMLGVKVTNITEDQNGLKVTFEGDGLEKSEQLYGRVLAAVGRRANGLKINANNAGVQVTERGVIPVDKQMRTNVGHIYAIGDVVGEPMLAHKASYEAKIAAEVIAGHKSSFDASVIPSVAYTDPEVAWVGITEQQANEENIDIEKSVFPWAASGRSLSNGRSEGFTKLIFDKETGRIIGAGIVGTSAGDLIAETALAIEMGCDASDIGLTIHPHPTLAETVAFASEVAEGTITDLYMPKR